MFKHFIMSLSLVSSLSLACGLHQDTGFNFVTEPGSLSVFGQVIEARKNNELGNVNKPDHFLLFTIKAGLAKSNRNKIDFSIFEAVKGHYSQVTVGKVVSVEGRDSLPKKDDLLVVTELDVLDALASQKISWHQAKAQGLVVVNGDFDSVSQLDAWFTDLF